MSRSQHNKPAKGAPALRAITFDVTQTLIHCPKVAETYGEILSRHGIKVGTRLLRKEIPWVWKEFSCRASPLADRFSQHPRGAKGWWHDFLVRICQRLDLATPTRFASAELFDRFAHASAWELFADVRPTISTLRERGLKLGIVSNWDLRLPFLLKDFGLEEPFDQITFSAKEGIEKPNPKLFLSCLAAMNVPPEQALHVGDHPIDDFEGAQAAGMAAVLIDRMGSSGPDLGQLLEPFLEEPDPSSLRPVPGNRSGGRHAGT